MKWSEQIEIREIKEKDNLEVVSNGIFIKNDIEDNKIGINKLDKTNIVGSLIAFCLSTLSLIFFTVLILLSYSEKSDSVEANKVILSTQKNIPIDSSLEGAPNNQVLQEDKSIDHVEANTLKSPNYNKEDLNKAMIKYRENLSEAQKDFFEQMKETKKMSDIAVEQAKKKQ